MPRYLIAPTGRLKSWELVRYEARSAHGSVVLLEVRSGMPDSAVEVDVDNNSELWRVNYEVLWRRGNPGKPELQEVGSWPLIPATRAEAKFSNVLRKEARIRT
jgi:hypothetical protein